MVQHLLSGEGTSHWVLVLSLILINYPAPRSSAVWQRCFESRHLLRGGDSHHPDIAISSVNLVSRNSACVQCASSLAVSLMFAMSNVLPVNDVVRV